MNISKTLTTAALALVLVSATAGSSMAATGWADHFAKVKKHHSNASVTVNTISAGQKVQVVNSWNNWYKIKIPGPDGWVKKNAISFNNWGPGPGWGGGYGGGYGGSFCINGQNAQFCISGGN
jgi:SH3-like domain-containing protein